MQTGKQVGEIDMPLTTKRCRPLRRVLLLLLVLMMVAVVRYVQNQVASDGNRVRHYSLQTASSTNPVPFSGSFRLATFNIAHGRGTNDSNWSHARERKARLQAIGELIKDQQIDLVVLNEVDFDAFWTGGENQAEIIASAAGLDHVLEQRNWDVAIPFVRLRFGNAILSRYPIVSARHMDLPPRSRWEKRFLGYKQSVQADIELTDGLTIRVLAAHLDHRSEATRLGSAEAVLRCARESTVSFFCMGDLNSSPSGGPTNAYPVTLFDTLLHSGLFQTRPESVPSAAELTYPSYAPNRAIDWILVPMDWTIIEHHVMDSTLSDHRPVIMKVRMDPNRL